MKVLIAEDDAVSRLMLRRAIEQLGHEVLVATDGTDAWELYRHRDVDVIVSDWLMPGMDGLDLCRRVRAPSARPIPTSCCSPPWRASITSCRACRPVRTTI